MKSSRKQAFYDKLTFEVFDEVYEPAEDTFLIADYFAQVVKETDTVLDIGTGCGILAVIAAKKALKVVATDLNPHAVECARLNVKTNNVSGKVDVRQGDLFKPIQKTEKFDVIIFNAPYLPSEPHEENTWIGRAWAGGHSGRQVVDRFIDEAPRYLKEEGRILLAQSTLANIEKTITKFYRAGLEASVVAEKKFPFETIVVVQAKAFIPRSSKE
jgi:release factor glutamine methyltransferase